MTRIMAPAKLTLSLAVTGVRPDGYHELRAEMVSLSLSDELTFTEGGTGLTFEADPGTRAESLVDDGHNLIARALVAVGAPGRRPRDQAHPARRGLGRRIDGCCGGPALGRRDDPHLARGLGSDVPFSVLGGGRWSKARGNVSPRWNSRSTGSCCSSPPFGVNTAQVYAAWDDRGGADRSEAARNALTGAALTVEPRLARWRDALGDLVGLQPTLAGSGSTWFVECGPAGDDTGGLQWLDRGDERARLIRAHTVPAGWNGG